MRNALRPLLALTLALAVSFGLVACSDKDRDPPPPAPTGPQALQFTSFTVSPSTVTAGSNATLSYTLANPGVNSTSSVTLQPYVSATPITLSSIGQPGVNALGPPLGISAIAPGKSESGAVTVAVTPPTGVTPPAAVFLALVATPSTGGSISNASPSVQVQLQ